MTFGYFKDVSHLKEMVTKAYNQELEEFYEVEFFDTALGMDEKTKAIFNTKLQDIKRQFEIKTKTLMSKLIIVSQELDKYKKQESAGEKQGIEYVMDCAKKLFAAEDNFYRLWKLFQDLKKQNGFFEVFEK